MAHAPPVAVTPLPQTPSMLGTSRAPPFSSGRPFSCPDCGELFPSYAAQLLHQLASEPAHAPPPAEPKHAAAPAAGAGAGAMDGITAAITAAVSAAMAQGGVGAAGAPKAAGAGVAEQFAPKHGVRLLRNAVDVAMVVPLLHAEPVVSLDLEGDLTPGATQGVDLMQLYLPSLDLAPPHGATRRPSRRPPPLGCLGQMPWLGSLGSDARSTHATSRRFRGPRACLLGAAPHRPRGAPSPRGWLLARLAPPCGPSPILPAPPLQALLVHTASMEGRGVARLLGPWLSSPAHHKVLCDCRADAEALQVVYGVRMQGVIDVQARRAPPPATSP